MPKQKMQVSDLLIRDSTSRNPFSMTPDHGALENMVPDYGRLVRVPFMPPFHSSASSSQVWRIVDFQFQRDNARNQQILIFKSDGKVYKRIAGRELEVFPGKTSFSALVRRPSVVNLADRLHISDGSQYLIYDGWDWFTAGLVAPTAPSTALVAGSLTGTFKVAVTAVHIRNGVRIHESSRSAVTSTTPSAQNVRVTKPTLDSRATHWSVYMSELSTSDVYRRVATVDANTSTTDIASVPTATSPTGPIRNDPLQPSQVLAQWKNRIVMRDEQAPSNLWFTSFGEVKGLLNGAPEECLPGRGSASISDLVNSWTLSDFGEPLQGAVWHEEFLWAFSNKNGYVIRGEGSLLDNRGLRDFFPLHAFNFGTASAWSTISTPFGLVGLTNERGLWLWEGSGEAIDIGKDIQTRLNALTDDQLAQVELTFWDAGGNQWLLVPLPNRVAVFDFSVRTQESPKGIWFTINGFSSAPTSIGQMNFNGQQILLLGFADGTVRQFNTDSQRAITLCQPAHLGLSFILGKVYLGSTVQASFTALARTASIQPSQGNWSEGMYVEVFHKGEGDTDSTGIRPPAPTMNLYYDELNPVTPTGAISLTLAAINTKEKRAWLKPSASASGAGALAKRFQFEMQFTTTTNDGASRQQVVNDEVWQFGFSWMPRIDLTL